MGLVCAIRPSAPPLLLYSEAVWGGLYSARKFRKFAISLVPTYLSLLTIVAYPLSHWKL